MRSTSGEVERGKTMKFPLNLSGEMIVLIQKTMILGLLITVLLAYVLIITLELINQ